jgi:hypothetical protein
MRVGAGEVVVAQFALRLGRGVRPVERAHAVRTLLPPVGEDAAQDLDRREAIAIGRMVVVEARLELDVPPGRDAAESGDIDIHRTRAQREDVDQVLGRPNLDIKAIDAAALQVLRDLGGQQERPAALSLHVQEHAPDAAHQIGHVLAKLPLASQRQAGNMPSEVELDTVEIVSLGDLAERVDRDPPHGGDAEVPQAMRPPALERPVGMGLLQRIGWVLPGGPLAVAAQVHFAHSMVPEAFQVSALGFLHEPPHQIDALVAPPLETGVRIERIEKLAGIDHVAQPTEVPPEGIDLRAGLVDVTEPVLNPLVEVEPDLAVAIVLDHDSPPAVPRPLVFRRELETGIIGQRRRRAGQRRPAPGNHGLQKAPTLQRLRWLVHRAAGPQPKRCCRSGQESS